MPARKASTLRQALLSAVVGLVGAASATAALADEPATQPPTGASRGFGMVRSIFGDILSDDRGFTVYTWDGDDPRTSNCYDDCAVQWPPFIVNTARPQGSGLNAALGVTSRSDGRLQATADGWPLYYFLGDTAPGQTNGHGAPGGWWVVNDEYTVPDPPPD